MTDAPEGRGISCSRSRADGRAAGVGGPSDHQLPRSSTVRGAFQRAVQLQASLADPWNDRCPGRPGHQL